LSDTVKLEIVVDDQGSLVIKNFKETVGAALGGVQKDSTGAGSSISQLWKQVAVGAGVANLVNQPLQTMVSEFKSMIPAAMEAEQVHSKLTSALRANGESAQVMGGILKDFADNMQAATGVTNGEIEGLTALAYNLKINKSLVQESVQGAIGLSTLYGSSMQSNLEAVARAYQGNWRQAEMLIPELRNLSDESDKLALLQKKMAEGFQASTDAMKGASGKIITAKNQWGDFKEEVGKVGLALFGALKSATDFVSGNSMIVNKLRAQYAENQAKIEELKKTHLTYNQVIADEGQKEKEIEDILGGVAKTRQDIADIFAKDKQAQINAAILKSESELAKKREEAAAIAEKYGLNIAGLNEAGREMYLQLMQIVGILPQFISEEDQARIQEFQIGMLQLTGIIPKFNEALDPAIIEKYGLDIDGLNEAGRELYVQLVGLSGLIPGFNGNVGQASDKTKKWSVDWKDANSVMEASQQLMGTVKQGLADIGVELGPQAEAFMGAAQGAATFVEGLTTGNPLTMIAGAFQFLGGIVKAFAGDGIGEAIRREQVLIGVNAQLIKQIKDLAKTMGDTHAATSVMLNDVIDQADVTVENFDTYASRIEGILSDYDEHALSLGDTAKEIGDSFTSLITKAKALGTEGSASMLKLMDDLNSRGIKVKEIQDYIADNWKMGLEGYKKYLEGDFSKATIGVFEYLLDYEKRVGANQALIDGVKGITQALVSMSNVTRLTEDEFNQFELAADDAFKKMTDSKNKNHLSEKEALMQLQPMLSRMIFLNKEYGLGIDAATQALIDKAKAAGVDLTLVKSQDELMGDMADSMKELVDLFKNAFPHAVDDSVAALKRFNNENPDTNGPTVPHGKGAPEIPAATGYEGWVAGGSRQSFLTGEDEDEYISITPRSRIGGMKSGGWMSERPGSDAPPVTVIKSISLDITINGVVTPEIAADAINVAIDKNTHGVRAKIEAL
jgi:hypothetical protein